MPTRDDIIKNLYEEYYNLITDKRFVEESLTTSNLLDRYDWCTGASKCVLFCKTGVIKIPFDGFLMGENLFVPFNGSCCPQDKSDYCLSEIYLYHEAKKFKVNRIFLKNNYLTSIGGKRIYFQKEAITVYHSEEEEKIDKDILRRLKELRISNHFGASVHGWTIKAYCWYGEKFMLRLVEFLDIYNIGDLTPDNLGYIGGTPVIIDYADYYS